MLLEDEYQEKSNSLGEVRTFSQELGDYASALNGNMGNRTIRKFCNSQQTEFSLCSEMLICPYCPACSVPFDLPFINPSCLICPGGSPVTWPTAHLPSRICSDADLLSEKEPIPSFLQIPGSTSINCKP